MPKHGAGKRVSFSEETRAAPMAHESETGVSTRPERYGASIVDERRDALRDKLKYFESKIDASDPAQVAALEEMREQTAEVERISGVWHTRGLPGVTREWNDPFYCPKQIAPPSSQETLMEYKRVKREETEFRAEGPYFSKGKLPPPPALQGLEEEEKPKPVR